MRFDKILSRIYPNNEADYNFDTSPQNEIQNGKPVTVQVRVYDDYDKIICNNTPIVSLADCEKEWNIYLVEQSNEEIDEKRRKEYGSAEEQLDMQYHDAMNGTTRWIDHITRVKSDNPKL